MDFPKKVLRNFPAEVAEKRTFREFRNRAPKPMFEFAGTKRSLGKFVVVEARRSV